MTSRSVRDLHFLDQLSLKQFAPIPREGSSSAATAKHVGSDRARMRLINFAMTRAIVIFNDRTLIEGRGQALLRMLRFGRSAEHSKGPMWLS